MTFPVPVCVNCTPTCDRELSACLICLEVISVIGMGSAAESGYKGESLALVRSLGDDDCAITFKALWKQSG